MKDIKKSLGDFTYTALMTLGTLGFLWVNDLLTGKQLLQDFFGFAFEPVNIMVQQMGINHTLFWAMFVAVLIIGISFNVIFWLILHGTMRVVFSLCRLYAKLCLWLNRKQPLKPAYIISKSIIILIAHFSTT